MTMVRKKLIEVSIPLEAINVASAREKSIRHGHPSTLHLWWARRPLAACRAVLFAQLVDDPSAWPDRFPTEKAQDIERRRLHKVIERMVPWEASIDEAILNEARWEIARSVAWGLDEEPPPLADGKAILDYLQTKVPPVYDPFCGGGAIPLEAQRLGLRSFGSDLNPVAVLISKALVEIPPKFAGRPPVNPKAQTELRKGGRWNGKGPQGLADDVRYYGEWMRNEAKKRVGHIYNSAKLGDGSEAAVIAWLWARTVICPNPACRCETPLLSSFVLSAKKAHERYLVPKVSQKKISFDVSNIPPTGFADPARGYKRGMSGIFQCAFCGYVTTRNYVAQQAMDNKLGTVLTAVVAEKKGGRVYLPADTAPSPRNIPEPDTTGLDVLLSPNPRDVWCRNFGLDTPASLFTQRQLVALTTYSDLVSEARERVSADAQNAGFTDDQTPLCSGGTSATSYADAVATYLALAVSKLTDYNSSLVVWSPTRDQVKSTFARQALPMVWDFAEVNIFAKAAGDIETSVQGICRTLANLPSLGSSAIHLIDASQNSFPVRPIVVSTDPPYYDNIGYADLSDFFYVWLKRSLSNIWPDLFRRLTTPKAEELVAMPYRHDGREAAEAYFMKGMGEALTAMCNAASDDTPLTIYYAFKQSEAGEDGVTSAGWASFLQAIVAAGLAIDGTWPVRTERGARSVSIGTNALASSIVLVCRRRAVSAALVTRADFVRALKQEMPESIDDIREAGVGPVDMQQSIIGPGMGIFSRYAKVLEEDDNSMSVKTALSLINRAWEEIENELDTAFDPETQVALAWFATYGFDTRGSGELIGLANAKNIPLSALFSSGVFTDLHGKAALTSRTDLPADWSPADATVWECVQHTARTLNAPDGGGEAAARLVAQMGPKAADARALAYRLYEICSQKNWAAEALVYNELAQEWARLEDIAINMASASSTTTRAQGAFTFDEGAA
jgi:putative DNA methylase